MTESNIRGHEIADFFSESNFDKGGGNFEGFTLQQCIVWVGNFSMTPEHPAGGPVFNLSMAKLDPVTGEIEILEFRHLVLKQCFSSMGPYYQLCFRCKDGLKPVGKAHAQNHTLKDDGF